jgi:hypothetical protein
MNLTEKFFSHFEITCGVHYCQTVFSSGEKEIVNNYKCNQRAFSHIDQWRMKKLVKPTSVGSNIFIH